MRAVAKLFALLLLAGASHVALAQYSCSINGPGSVQANFPATVRVPRDAPVGTLLTGWVGVSAADNWRCSFPRNNAAILWLDLAVATSNRINNGGTNYALINTNVDGVGIIVRFTDTTSLQAGTLPWSTPGTQETFVGSALYNNQSQQGRGVFSANAEPNTLNASRSVSLALIRSGTQSLDGKSMSSGTVGRSGIRFQLLVSNSPIVPDASQPLRFTHDINYTGVTFIESTCQTPDVTFNMGSVPLSTFQGSGTRNGNWQNQNLNINNCPAGLNRVSVVLATPSTGWLDSVNKVFKLNNPSDVATAQGIGIQLGMGPTQTIPSYDTQILLNSYGYNSATGGSFAVPLWARYVKPASSATVSPGRANGMMIFTMVYQ